MSKRRAKKLRRLAGEDGVVIINGKPVVAPAPKVGRGFWRMSGAGKHTNKKRKFQNKLDKEALKDW
jgi:hypothetical protein